MPQLATAVRGRDIDIPERRDQFAGSIVLGSYHLKALREICRINPAQQNWDHSQEILM